jgi:hypothetical protein
MPPASADPYAWDHSGEVVSSDPGYYEAPAGDAGGWDQGDFVGLDVANPGGHVVGAHRLRYDVQLASSDEETPRTAAETLVTVAVGCGVLALASLAFFVIKGRGRRTDDD